MMFARRLRMVLAVALLAAWTNALVHPIEHVDEAGGFVHLAGGHADNGHDGEERDPLCDAIAAVAAGVHGSSNAVLASTLGHETPDSGKAGSIPGAPLLAYRSQAPPQFS